MFKQIKATIIKNEKIQERYYKMVLETFSSSWKIIPGQFIYIRINKTLIPLLRRPFSIYELKGSQFEILYEIKGEGTLLLANKTENQEMDFIGPLGNGFNLKAKFKKAVLIGGGIGIAPLLILAQELQRRKKKALIFLGMKNNSLVVFKEDFERVGYPVKIATEDGSFGNKGKITDLLAENLEEGIEIFACGPISMYKKISNIIKSYAIKCQVLLEERMGCGIGMCFGCVCKIKQKRNYKYKRVCIEGPVFYLNKIDI